MEEKITANMSMAEIIMVMSEGNPGALFVIKDMLTQSPMGFVNLLTCDTYGIRGSRLYMLNNDCCARNDEKFNLTLKMIRNGVFSKEDIDRNLGMVRAIPFVENSLIEEYGVNIDESDPRWAVFCQRAKESFVNRISSFGQGSRK